MCQINDSAHKVNIRDHKRLQAEAEQSAPERVRTSKGPSTLSEPSQGTHLPDMHQKSWIGATEKKATPQQTKSATKCQVEKSPLASNTT